MPPNSHREFTNHRAITSSHALTGRELPGDSESERPPNFSPTFLTFDEYYVVRQLTAQLLGETPGVPIVDEVTGWVDRTVLGSAEVRKAALALAPAHRTLAVHYYGEKAVRELEELDPQAICREGLAWFARGKSLEAISDDRPEPRAENAGTRFFTYLKGRVIEGFYTSRAGLEELGRGNPNFYASPPGCSIK